MQICPNCQRGFHDNCAGPTCECVQHAETVFQMLVRRIQPNYVGWEDQYLAILHALEIHPDMPTKDFQFIVELVKDI